LTTTTFSGALSGNATTATTATNITGGAAGSIPYQTASSTTTTLALGTSGYVLQAGASAPSWVASSTITAGNANDTVTNLTNGNGSTVVIGNIVYATGTSGTFNLAEANSSAATAKPIGFVQPTSITASSTGNIVTGGVMTASTAQWDAVNGSSGGLTVGSVYYLSPSTAGAITTTAPSTTGQWVVRVGVALSSTQLQINFGPPVQL
jgi:hypothetical protein